MQADSAKETSPRTPEGMLETLDRFFSLVDTDHLFVSQDPIFKNAFELSIRIPL